MQMICQQLLCISSSFHFIAFLVLQKKIKKNIQRDGLDKFPGSCVCNTWAFSLLYPGLTLSRLYNKT